MADPFAQYANTFNKIGGTGGQLINSTEPLTISTRKNQSSALGKLRMGAMDSASAHRRLMQQFQDEQWKKENEAGLLDYLGIIPQAWSTANSIAGRHGGPNTNFGVPTGGGYY